MAYSLCFICTNKIQGYFEFSKKQTTAGILCELLQIQLKDSTFTFPPKLQQAPYCHQCVQKLKEAYEILNNLKELENQIQNVRNEVENKLKESCKKRRLIGDNSTGEESENEDGFHHFDKFREDVVKEAQPNFFSSKNSYGMKFNLQKTPTSTKKVVNESLKTFKHKIPELDSNSSTKKSSHPRSNLKKLSSRSYKAVSSENISVNTLDSSIPKNMIHKYEDVQIMDLENAFVSIMSETDTGKGHQKSPELGLDVEGIDNIEDTEEIFVDATSDGRFQCPYAPVCKNTFLPTDKENFLNHVRLFHKGKLPIRVKKLPVVELENPFTCKFCEEVFTSTKLLKHHHHKEHGGDEEWFPENEALKKKRTVSESSGQSGSKKKYHKYMDSQSNEKIGVGRMHGETVVKDSGEVEENSVEIAFHGEDNEMVSNVGGDNKDDGENVELLSNTIFKSDSESSSEDDRARIEKVRKRKLPAETISKSDSINFKQKYWCSSGRQKAEEWKNFETIRDGKKIISNICMICKVKVSPKIERIRQHLLKCNNT